MADKQRQHQQQGSQYGQQHPRAYYAAKAATFLTMGGSLLVLSGLVLTGTVVALVLATPIFVIFSPVLVPAVITASLIVTGFLSSGGFGVAAVAVLSWIYKYVTGKRTPGVDQIDQASHKLAGKNEPGFGQFSVLV